MRVATRPLAAGERLAESDSRVETRWIPGPPPARSAEDILGWETRRPIATGDALVRPAVAPPRVIEAGSPVTVTWERGGVRLAMAGVALSGARAGEPVRVRLDGRPAKLTGVAVAPGRVSLAEGGTR
jgi:flagella basal body P-ring formation protein FlgA